MTREEIIEMVKTAFDVWENEYDTGNDWSKEHKARDMAVEALEQETCKDAVSRQAVLDGLASIAKIKAKSDAQKSLMGRVMFFVEQLPPVTPQLNIGRWIYGEDNLGTGRDGWYCNQCGHFEFWDYSLDMKSAKLNLPNPCPNCGAKMIEPQERSKNKKCFTKKIILGGDNG